MSTAVSTLVDFSPEQIALIKRTICKPKEREATNDELALFIGQCKRTGLDPFAKQIYAVFRKQQGREQMTIQTGIDGLRVIAERAGDYLGQTGPFWCGDDGVWKDTWFPSTNPKAAKVIVRRAVAGQVAETPAVAMWDEYVVKFSSGISQMWKDKPALMLAKCAEALALRKAFPNDMSGLVSDAEMERADAPPVRRAEPDAPPAADAVAEAIDETPLTMEAADLLVSAAADAGCLEQLRLAASNIAGEDVGSCESPAEAIAAIAKLNASQAERVAAWIQSKAQAVPA